MGVTVPVRVTRASAAPVNPRGGDGERAVAVGGEVSGVGAHGGEGEDGATAVVRGEADDGTGGVFAAALRVEGGDDGVAAEVYEGAALVREGELRGGRLVRAEALDLGIRVHLAHRRVRLDLVRADREGAAGDAGRRDGAGAKRWGDETHGGERGGGHRALRRRTREMVCILVTGA